MPNRFNDHTDDNISTDCSDEMWQLLNIYADGEASPEEAVRVEDLLRSDASYARQFAFVKTTTAAVQSSFAELDPPSSLRNAILASTSQRVTWGSRLSRLRDRRSLAPRYATSLVGLAAAGLLAFVVVQYNSGRNRNTISGGTANVSQPTVASSNDGTTQDLTINVGPNIDLPQDTAAVATGTYRPQPPHTRMQLAVLLPRVDKKSMTAAPGYSTTGKSKLSAPRHDDGAGPLIAQAYQPDKDAQFERNPGTVAAPESQPVEIPGDDVHIADTDPAPAVTAAHSTQSETVALTQASTQRTAPHTYVAKLTALPPDPNQVFTKADMARNRAVFTSGYDRSTLKSMERKETSISILRGSF